MPLFLDLSNFYFPFNILSDVILPRNLAQYPHLIEGAPYLQHSNPAPTTLGAPRTSSIQRMPGATCMDAGRMEE